MPSDPLMERDRQRSTAFFAPIVGTVLCLQRKSTVMFANRFSIGCWVFLFLFFTLLWFNVYFREQHKKPLRLVFEKLQVSSLRSEVKSVVSIFSSMWKTECIDR